VELDPTFPSAFAELAQAYVWKLFLFAPQERQWEEKAFMATEKALSTAADGFPCYPLFETDSNLNNLRQEARFIIFMTKLKQQWEAYRTMI
jgi:hypothetical protein